MKFKHNYSSETYLKTVFNRQHRSAISQFRCGILPLRIETDHYTSIPEHYRLCLMCDQDVVESETHFLLYCTRYNMIRQDYFNNILVVHPDFSALSDNEKLMILMSDQFVKRTAQIIWQCFELRRHYMYIST